MKKIFIGVVIAIILAGLALAGYMCYKNNKEIEPLPENKPEQLDSIDSYGYKLEDRDTVLFKDTYEELKQVLLEEKIDYNEYAKLLSELYIIDLYTINNKISKYDVGGGDYVYPTSRDNYELKVRDTIYKYVEDNSYNTRVQDLPEVKSVNVDKIEDTKYKIEEKEYSGYKADLTWEYIKEEDYDKKATVYLINDKGKLYIVEQKKS